MSSRLNERDELQNNQYQIHNRNEVSRGKHGKHFKIEDAEDEKRGEFRASRSYPVEVRRNVRHWSVSQWPGNTSTIQEL